RRGTNVFVLFLFSFPCYILYICPLPTDHTYFNSLFTTPISSDILGASIIHHYNLFSKAIADVACSNGFSECHASLTQGLR
ncbi:unnamed protein product, partial [Rotaria sp. Silwood2]